VTLAPGAVGDAGDSRGEHSTPARRALYLAGEDSFAERGFHGTTVDGIVDAAGHTKGAFYHHWESKQALLHEIMLGLIRLQARLADDATRWSGAPDRSLHRFLGELFELVLEHRKAVRIFHAQVGMLEQADFADVRETAGRFRAAVGDLIRRGSRSGRLRELESVELTTWVISGAVSHAYRAWPLDEPHTPRDVGRMVGHLIMPGLTVTRARVDRPCAGPPEEIQPSCST
jgi:AcrR family transcriptional regulator